MEKGTGKKVTETPNSGFNSRLVPNKLISIPYVLTPYLPLSVSEQSRYKLRSEISHQQNNCTTFLVKEYIYIVKKHEKDLENIPRKVKVE